MKEAPSCITLLAFATARDLLGAGEQTVELHAPETPAQLVDRLWPGLRPRLSPARVAIDENYASWDTVLCPGQTLAIIPPVSGG
jgi:molybdopterin converting factor small subunit